MKNFDKEKAINYGTYAAGLVLVITSCMRMGAYNVLNTIKASNVKITDEAGNLVDFTLPSRFPFKK